MENILIFHAFRLFSPILSFITPYFVDKKKIKNTTFHNKVIPFFFISGFCAGIFGSLFVGYFGENILIADTFLDLFFLISIPFMSNEKNGILIVVTCMHGASSSLSLLTKSLLYAGGGSKKKIYSKFNAIKRISSVFSSWMGQDLFFASSDYTPALLMSIISTIICFIISFFVTNTPQNAKDSLITVHKITSDSFTRNYIFFSLLNIIFSTIYVSFAIYSANIFIERRRNISMASNFVGKFFYHILIPLRLL